MAGGTTEMCAVAKHNACQQRSRQGASHHAGALRPATRRLRITLRDDTEGCVEPAAAGPPWRWDDRQPIALNPKLARKFGSRGLWPGSRTVWSHRLRRWLLQPNSGQPRPVIPKCRRSGRNSSIVGKSDDKAARCSLILRVVLRLVIETQAMKETADQLVLGRPPRRLRLRRA